MILRNEMLRSFLRSYVVILMFYNTETYLRTVQNGRNMFYNTGTRVLHYPSRLLISITFLWCLLHLFRHCSSFCLNVHALFSSKCLVGDLSPLSHLSHSSQSHVLWQFFSQLFFCDIFEQNVSLFSLVFVVVVVVVVKPACHQSYQHS